ncbi:MAG TPA: hypothetical protein VFB45_05445 [Pseudolabrys sp.]|nr:hypothetical protein [Pseudolabrys sp.]
MHMRTIIAAVTVAALSSALPARAELGPCRDDGTRTLLCGSGVGAARVIPDTASPDKRFAFAWHNAESAPDDVDEDSRGNEWLLIRLADGKVLAKAETDYFYTATLTANRQWEQAIWSPDARLVLRRYETRYSFDALTLYRLEGDTLAGQVDLSKIVDGAVRSALKKLGRPVEDHVVATGNKATLRNDGTLRIAAIGSVIKKPETDVSFALVIKTTASKGGLAARLVSIKRLPDDE